MRKILVTGSSGLIGTALVDSLRKNNFRAVGVDERRAISTDFEHYLVPNDRLLAQLLNGVTGVVHLAGVSRVVWGQRDPFKCWESNVRFTASLIEAAMAVPSRPWLIYASSREVYGQATILPIPDDAPVAPLNVYACSKAAAEMLIAQAVNGGRLRAGVLRFSTVYGGLGDHPDRVIPAFMRGALRSEPITVYGSEVALDPTWIGDVVDGIIRLASALGEGRMPERPILLSGGVPVRLVDLAHQICARFGRGSRVTIAPRRSFDVEYFAGLADYASEFLGWTRQTQLEEGLDLYARLLGATVYA